MILLDTHIWVWWVNGDGALSTASRHLLDLHEEDSLGVSIISCWEIAKKAEVGKMELDRPVTDWLKAALAYPGVTLLGLTPDIVVESTQLPQPFHRDPADQMIVATSRVLATPLLTADARLLAYEHVAKVQPQ